MMYRFDSAFSLDSTPDEGPSNASGRNSAVVPPPFGRYSSPHYAFPPGPFNTMNKIILEAPKNKKDYSRNWKGVHPAKRRVLGQRRHRASAWGQAEQRKKEQQEAAVQDTRSNTDEGYEDSEPVYSAHEEFELIYPAHYNPAGGPCIEPPLLYEDAPQEVDYSCAAEGFSYCDVYEEPRIEFQTFEDVDAPFHSSSSDDSTAITVRDFVDERKEMSVMPIVELRRAASQKKTRLHSVIQHTPNLESAEDLDPGDVPFHILDFRIGKLDKGPDKSGNPATNAEPIGEAYVNGPGNPASGAKPTREAFAKEYSVTEVKELLCKLPIQRGTVIYAIRGTEGDIPAALNVISVKQLPYKYRNSTTLRKLANRGFLVITHRLRDCDTNTIYLIPNHTRFCALMLYHTFQRFRTIDAQYAMLRKILAVKFALGRYKTVNDFLKARMVRYKTDAG